MEVIENQYLYLLLLFPLVGSLLSFVSGTFLFKKYKNCSAGWIASFFSSLTAILALFLLFKLNSNTIFEQKLFQWLSVDWVQISLSLSFDSLTAVMVAFVTGVATLIHFYAIGYMKDDGGQGRFFSYFNLFLFFMLLLLLASNLAVLFIGWEGVGLVSYLLIGFEFQKDECATAGRKAFLVNRIGDAGFLVGMLFLFFYVGSLDFANLQAFNFSTLALTFVGFCFLLGAIGKSAQFPLFVWLPDAMLGPTPVSALIHAATMVTAGVYLLVRCSYLFVSPLVATTILILSIVTIFIGALAALFQDNFKKVLAFSTISQLGLMFAITAIGVYSLAILHIVMHAFFKACLFLVAGIVIKATNGRQNFSEFGGLWRKTPVSFIAYTLATLSIIGMYPLAGYYSKHAIVSALGGSFSCTHLSLILILSAILTTCYMTRSLYLVFFGKCNCELPLKKTPLVMIVPVCILALLATFAGIIWGEKIYNYLNITSLTPFNYFGESISNSLINSWSEWGVLIVSFILLCFCSNILEKICNIFKHIILLCKNGFYIDKFYQACIVKAFVYLAKFLSNIVEKYIIDGAVEGLATFVVRFGRAVAKYFEKYVIDAFVESNAKIAVLNGKFLSLLQCGQIRFYTLLVFLTVFFSVMYIIF